MSADRTTWQAEARRAAIEECLAIVRARKWTPNFDTAYWNGAERLRLECEEAIASLLDKEPT